MVSDGRCMGDAKFEGITLSIEAADAAEADRLFSALAEGGKVIMPQSQTFFSPRFGMVADKFGVHWMVIVPQPMS
jgi:PhnB protein